MGITLKHSGHFLVVGSTGFCFLVKEISLFMGRTTKKYITAALIRNDIKAFRKSPIMNLLLLIVKYIEEKLGFPPIAAINGVMRSLTSADTTFPNATPMTMPTARSTTLPFNINCLNPCSIRLQYINILSGWQAESREHMQSVSVFQILVKKLY